MRWTHEKRLPTGICANPNCDYRGEFVRVDKGDAVLMIVLLLLFLVPGIIYALYWGLALRPEYHCPRCHQRANLSPS